MINRIESTASSEVANPSTLLPCKKSFRFKASNQRFRSTISIHLFADLTFSDLRGLESFSCGGEIARQTFQTRCFQQRRPGVRWMLCYHKPLGNKPALKREFNNSRGRVEDPAGELFASPYNGARRVVSLWNRVKPRCTVRQATEEVCESVRMCLARTKARIPTIALVQVYIEARRTISCHYIARIVLEITEFESVFFAMNCPKSVERECHSLFSR